MKYLLFYDRVTGAVVQTVATVAVGETLGELTKGDLSRFFPAETDRIAIIPWDGALVSGRRLRVNPTTHEVTWELPILQGGGDQDKGIPEKGDGPRPEPQGGSSDQQEGEDSTPKIYGADTQIALRPIVFVPGILGSSIRKKGSVEYLWPPATVDGQGHFQVFQHLQDLARPGVQREATREFPVVYAPLLDFLESLRGKINFHPFWYDWTQSNKQSGEQLAEHISKVLALPRYVGKFDQVDLICHSMGGLVTRAAALLFGMAPKIRRSVYVASPHYGAPKAYFVLHPEIDYRVVAGFFQNFIAEWVWKLYIQGPEDESTIELEMRALSQQMDSTFELLPDQFYLDKNVLITDRYPGSSFPIRGLPGTYYANDWKWPDRLLPKVRKAMSFKDSLGAAVPGDANTTLVLYSHTDPTLDVINYYHQYIVVSGFGSPSTSDPQNGDQTVPARSATANGSAPNLDSVPGEHVALINNPPTHYKIGKFLQRAPA